MAILDVDLAQGGAKKGVRKRGSATREGSELMSEPFPSDVVGGSLAGEREPSAGVRWVSVSEIDESEDGNPRKIARKNLERLKKSITDNPDFFEARPVLLNRIDGRLRIIGGHQRLKAAKAVGMERVPCFIFEGLSEERAKRFTILDNTNEGAWDFTKLQEYAVDVDLSEFNVAISETIDYNKIVTHDVLNAIIYKPSAERAEVSEFLDNELYDRVADKVARMEIPEELREFVAIRLANFHRIRFDKVADYYARADEPTRLLFRQLALVFDVSGTTFEQDVMDFYNVGLDPSAYE